MATHDTATAHQVWQERWASAAGRADWVEPDPDVISVATGLRGQERPVALDLGCGVGRHALYLAAQGFVVSAYDASDRGIDVTRTEAARRGLSIALAVGPMTDLPYATGQFDYVLAWNVIYHGDADVVRQCLAEIRRVLRPGGLYQSTMLSKRHTRYGQGREIAPNTFVIDEGGDNSDKAHPHFYCNAAEIVDLFRGFDLVSLIDREQGGPGTQHWHIVAERSR
jgi:tellurite methyltransferase